jgi:hypothetical protein
MKSYVRRLLQQRGVDPALVADDMRFLTTEKLGPKQSLTPEGFLVVHDTPVARAGWQIYAPQEIPDADRFSPPPDGIFRVWRDEKEVFSSEAMASGNGKPVVDEHPDQVVTPETHEGAPGVSLDPRRGTGIEDDLLVMDLIIYNKDLIAAVKSGKRELSLGYDVDYEEIEPGKLAQKNIRINHVALVDSGRCGPRCSIGDHSHLSTATEELTMARHKTNNKVGVLDRIRRVLAGGTALSAKDKEELEKALEEGEKAEDADDPDDPKHHLEIHNHMPAAAAELDDDPDPAPAAAGGSDLEERVARLETAIHEMAEMVQGMSGGGATEGATSDDPDWKKKIEDDIKALKGEDPETDEGNQAILGELELEAPPGAEAVDVRRAKDSRYLVDSYQATVAMAEIIAPGVRVPTFDKATKPAKSFKAICDLRRSALDAGHSASPEVRGMIDEVLNGRQLAVKTMSCDAVRSLFNAVGVMKKNRNNQALRVGDGTGEQRRHGEAVGGVKTLADLQRNLNDHYKKTA